VSHGLLAIGGVISLLMGSMMLIRSGSSLEMVRISRTVIISATAISALFFLFIVGAGLKAQRARPVTGIDGLVGDIGETIDELAPLGLVRIQGETWNAESLAGTIQRGAKVRVREMKNMKLFVEPVNI
jgi:membrane-bound serine protease (ClpP class)